MVKTFKLDKTNKKIKKIYNDLLNLYFNLQFAFSRLITLQEPVYTVFVRFFSNFTLLLTKLQYLGVIIVILI